MSVLKIDDLALVWLGAPDLGWMLAFRAEAAADLERRAAVEDAGGADSDLASCNGAERRVARPRGRLQPPPGSPSGRQDRSF